MNEEFEEKLSKPFYFRQGEHGSITEVLFPKNLESPEIAAFKKGKNEIRHLNLENIHSPLFPVMRNCSDLYLQLR